MKKSRRCSIVFLCFTMFMLLASGIVHTEPARAADGMTRAEWIHNLTVVFGMTVDEDNYPDNYYCDISAADSSYRDIMIATEFGVIDVDAGKEFQPDAALTRDFAAHTLNYCLGFQRQDESYTYSDVEDVPEQYRNDVQTAIDRGWFALVSGAFAPSRAVTSSETTVMLNDAKAWLNATKIDKNHDNSFTYESDFLEVPDGTEVEVANGQISIFDTSISIEEGDKFVIYQSGLPQAFQAKTVTRKDDALIILVESVDNSEAIKTADAQGVTEGDLGTVVAAEGVDIYYEKEAETAPLSEFSSTNFQMRRNMTSSRISNKKKIKSISLSKKIGGNCTVKAKLSGLSVEYRVDGLNDVYVAVTGDAKISATGSFSNAGVDSVPLGSINVGGIADVTIRAKMLVTGKIVITYGTDFTAGVHYTSGKFRLVKDFHKKSFTIASEIKMTTGLEASVNVNRIPGIRGKIYAEIGAKTSITSKMRPGGKPAMCMHIFSYLYAEAGASVTVGVGGFSKTFSQKAIIFNAKNSPVRVAWHYEDGVLKGSGCSIEPDWNYCTEVESRYGINSSGYGIDGSGETVPIFTYTLDDDGNATITGYKGNSYLLSIPDEIDGHPVVAIGGDAFSKNTSFTSLIIPETVKKIKNSFRECTSLESATFPSEFNVDINGFAQWDRPFLGCSSLKEVSFGAGIVKIPNDLLCGCTGLETIEIPNTVTEIQGGVFSGCSSLHTVVLHEGLEVIGDAAFKKCSSLKNILLPSSLKKLYNNAFEACISLEQINIPKNMVAENVMGGSYKGPFFNCSSLHIINFEKGITRIPGRLFSECNGLRNIELPDTVTRVNGFNESSLSSITIPESVEVIEGDAFSGCKNLTEIKLPHSLKTLSNNSFEDCVNLVSVSFPNAFQVSGVIGGAFVGPFYGCKSLANVSFEEGIKTLPNNLFSGSGLANITIPNTVTKIEGGAFSKCSSLKEVDIPNSVTEIDGGTFSNCKALEKVNYSKNLTYIPGGIFENCSMLSEINIHDKITSIGGSSFKNCSSIKQINLPSFLSKIEGDAFYGCKNITKIEIPSSVTWIGDNAFRECTNLSEVVLKNGLSGIGTCAFYNDKVLEKIVIPDTVETLGRYVFANCEKLSEVSIGTGVTQIPDNAFEYTAISEIIFPWQITTVSNKAFANCVNLIDVTVNQRVTNIAEGTFSYKNKLTIHGVKGTYAETYANNNEINFNAISVPVERMVLDEMKCEIEKGQSKRLILNIEPKKATDEVIWSSADDKIVKIDANGKITGVSLGKTTVKAIAGEKEVACEVNVYQPIKSISLNISSKELYENDTLQLNAEIYPSNATYKELIWLSEQEDIAVVDNNGLVTAKSEGATNILVKSSDGSKQAKCSIKVIKKMNISDFLDLTSNDSYVINDNGFLTGVIQDCNTIREVSQVFKTENLIFKDIKGNTLNENDLLGTDATITVVENDTVKASCKVILAGDTNGDGKVNGKDVSRLARSFVGKEELTEAQQAAADVWEDGALNGKDVSKIARSLVGKDTISSQKKPSETEEPTKTPDTPTSPPEPEEPTKTPDTPTPPETEEPTKTPDTPTPPPEMEEPTNMPTEKNEQDVAALKALIAEQRERGATVSEDIDDDYEYEWENGRLVSICWETTNLSGELDVTGCTALTTLDCSENEISSLDVSENVFLKTLQCSRNQIGSLDVSGCTMLTYLNCYENALSSLDVSKNTALEWLRCYSNRLSNLDVSKNTVLKWLDCSYNGLISSLDVSKNTALEWLDCSYNELGSLDMSKNTVLKELHCKSNRQLSNLDVSGCIMLTYLNCYENALSSLDVSKNTALEWLDCSNNRLSSLNLTNNTKLEMLSCDSNVTITGYKPNSSEE